MGNNIHPTAIIHPGAKLGDNVEIGAYSIIEGEVTIADNNWIDSHVIIKGKTTIGTGNRIGAHSTLGFPAQDKKSQGEPTRLEIGDHNDIREYVSMHTGTIDGGGVTRLGNHNQIMGYTHLAHDVQVGDNIMTANAVQFAGHAEIGNNVVMGGMSGVHQFTHVGDFVMVGSGTIVTQDVSPFMMVNGQRGSIIGVNKVGMKRNGFSSDEVRQAIKIVKIVFHSNLKKDEAVSRLKEELPDERVLKNFLNFISNSTRGLMR